MITIVLAMVTIVSSISNDCSRIGNDWQVHCNAVPTTITIIFSGPSSGLRVEDSKLLYKCATVKCYY
jgi:hypothetical protein